MRRIIFAVLVCIPILVCAKESEGIDDLKAKDPTACQDIKKEDGYYGLLECTKRIVDNSEQKLKVRLLEIRKDLTKIGDAEFTAAFEVEQKSWARYKNDRCKYITTGMDMQRSAYQFQFDVCNATENYRRLETLVGDPRSS